MEVSLPGRVPINPLFLDDYPIKNPILTLTIWINHDFHSIFTTIIGETRKKSNRLGRSNTAMSSRSPRSWRVVGGGDKGGIVVRCGEDVQSELQKERLGTGAVVVEVGDRRSGWGATGEWCLMVFNGDGFIMNGIFYGIII